MMLLKILFVVVTPVLVVAGSIWLIAAILSVDDLEKCGTKPQSGHPQCQTVDAIIAISGGDTNARTAEAIELYTQGWAPKLVFSGAALDTSSRSNAAAMRDQAVSVSVPVGDIILDEQAIDTAGNAAGLSVIAKSQGFDRVILVTSPYHQRRASLEFARVLGDNIEIVNHPTSQDRYWPLSRWWQHPFSWYLALSETIKLIYVSITR